MGLNESKTARGDLNERVAKWLDAPVLFCMKSFFTAIIPEHAFMFVSFGRLSKVGQRQAYLYESKLDSAGY